MRLPCLAKQAQGLFTSLLLLSTTTVAAARAQDTVVVRIPEVPLWGHDPVLSEELRLGVLEGDERYSFGYISGVAIDTAGRIWVADRQAGVIRRYTALGEYIDDVGRPGEGPGEFKYLMDLRLTPDGNVSVWDPLGTGLHLFAPNGRFIRSHRVPVRGMFGFPQNLEVDRFGRFYAVALDPPTERGGGYRAYWLRLGPDGAFQDTVRFALARREGAYHAVHTYTAVSPLGYVVTGRNDEYAFDRGLPDGRVARIMRDLAPTPYAPSERREAQTFEELFAERRGEPAREIPPSKPFWSSFQIDSEGRIWVARYSAGQGVEESESQKKTREQFGNPARTWGQDVVFDVLDPRGQWLGTIRFPDSAWASSLPRAQVLYARGDEAWVLEYGEFEEQYVVRYKIVPSEK